MSSRRGLIPIASKTFCAWLLLSAPCDSLFASPPGPEVRLRERGANDAPKVARTDQYEVRPDELLGPIWLTNAAGDSAHHAKSIPNPTKPGAQTLQIVGNLVSRLPLGTLAARKSYRLTVTARTATEATTSIAIRFREPKSNKTFRTFRKTIGTRQAQDYTLNFTAPVFTDLAELSFEVNDGTLLVDAISLRMQPQVPLTERVPSWKASFVPDGYELVFNDEFSGATLNRDKWFTRYWPNSETLDRMNDEQQLYRDNDNHVLHKGVLSLVARRTKGEHADGVNYESGMLRSDWTVRYGFFETRVKMPGGVGVFPAFWLISDVSEAGRINWPPEIDFFEFVNNGVEDRTNKIHIAASRLPGTTVEFTYTHPSYNPAHYDYVAPFDFSAGWHTIAMEWTPESLVSYVDGLMVMARRFQWVFSDGAPAGPAQILFNLAIGGHWAGRHGINDNAFPQALEVDWVRVYQKAKP